MLFFRIFHRFQAARPGTIKTGQSDSISAMPELTGSLEAMRGTAQMSEGTFMRLLFRCRFVACSILSERTPNANAYLGQLQPSDA